MHICIISFTENRSECRLHHYFIDMTLIKQQRKNYFFFLFKLLLTVRVRWSASTNGHTLCDSLAHLRLNKMSVFRNCCFYFFISNHFLSARDTKRSHDVLWWDFPRRKLNLKQFNLFLLVWGYNTPKPLRGYLCLALSFHYQICLLS